MIISNIKLLEGTLNVKSDDINAMFMTSGGHGTIYFKVLVCGQSFHLKDEEQYDRLLKEWKDNSQMF